MPAFRDAGGSVSLRHVGDSNSQGVMRLDRQERGFVASQMQNMLRAQALRQIAPLSAAAVSERVGIYDANYFSRLFKQLMGYPPGYFRPIQT